MKLRILSGTLIVACLFIAPSCSSPFRANPNPVQQGIADQLKYQDRPIVTPEGAVMAPVNRPNNAALFWGGGL